MRSAFLAALLAFTPALASAQQPCTSDADSAVDAIYRQVLERPVGGEGGGHADRLRSGQTTVRELVREIAKSPEHRQRFLATNEPNARVNAVTNLYRHLLARAPDPGGLNSHVQALSNQNIDTIIDTIMNSQEYLQKWGEDTVPGGTRRYCRDGSGSAVNSPQSRMRFRNMDRNGNGAIEREEWNGSQNSFDVHDWNNDNVLSGDEVQPGARRAARAAGEDDFEPTMPATWTADAFRQGDRNRDGRITSSEWFYSAEYFRRADRNRDGALTLEEFTSTSMDDDRDDRFDNLDNNRNGRIERSEWHGSLDAFEWLDRNNDNVLSRTEVIGTDSNQFDSFASLDANRNGTLTQDECKWTIRSFNRYDTDGDGLITRREFNASGGAPTSAR
jgi:Ca2+-binding EF-hand superfamily protein